MTPFSGSNGSSWEEVDFDSLSQEDESYDVAWDEWEDDLSEEDMLY